MRIIIYLLIAMILCNGCGVQSAPSGTVIDGADKTPSPFHPLDINDFEFTYAFGDVLQTNDLSLDIPETLGIHESTPIHLDDATLQSFSDNLANAQWPAHTFTSSRVPGLYFASCVDSLSAAVTDPLDAAHAFFDHSGMRAYFAQHNIRILDPMKYSADTLLFQLDVNGIVNESYIRINLRGPQAIEEMKMHLTQDQQVTQMPSIPLDQALDRAFYHSEKSIGSHTSYHMQQLQLRYIGGLPFYCFQAVRDNTQYKIQGYALAVSWKDVCDDEQLRQQLIAVFERLE